ncbi:hypothetical protein IV55_GL001222 [Furfurilactobacillus siliginis]|nr:hypothetical protein IV55_GL001222 [Furfurilactobacillus siliginis]
MAYLLLRLRPRLFHTQLFKPMLLNIRLSLAPLLILVLVVIGELVVAYLIALANVVWLSYLVPILAVIGVIVWLLFLPNSGYLVTELNLTHREMDTHEVPIWYDIIAVLFLALSGVINMCLNVLLFQFVIILAIDPTHLSSLNNPVFWGFTILLFFVLAFGIYMGRYIRFNSWDLLHPLSFLKKLADHFSAKANLLAGSLFTLLYGGFFALFYQFAFLPPLLTFMTKK